MVCGRVETVSVSVSVSVSSGGSGNGVWRSWNSKC